jgi:hypothetical protein
MRVVSTTEGVGASSATLVTRIQEVHNSNPSLDIDCSGVFRGFPEFFKLNDGITPKARLGSFPNKVISNYLLLSKGNATCEGLDDERVIR